MALLDTENEVDIIGNSAIANKVSILPLRFRIDLIVLQINIKLCSILEAGLHT